MYDVFTNNTVQWTFRMQIEMMEKNSRVARDSKEDFSCTSLIVRVLLSLSLWWNKNKIKIKPLTSRRQRRILRSGWLSAISRFWQLTRLEILLPLKPSQFLTNIIFTRIPQSRIHTIFYSWRNGIILDKT